eukprot:8684653-Alexandrium_andersonii.AAC.1
MLAPTSQSLQRPGEDLFGAPSSQVENEGLGRGAIVLRTTPCIEACPGTHSQSNLVRVLDHGTSAMDLPGFWLGADDLVR